MVWLNLSPIPVGRRGQFPRSNDFTYLRYTYRGGGGGSRRPVLYTQTLDLTLALTLEYYRLVFSTDPFICFGFLDADIQSSSFWFLEFYILNSSSNFEFVSTKINAIDIDVDIL
jgi:hypothetical protein